VPSHRTTAAIRGRAWRVASAWAASGWAIVGESGSGKSQTGRAILGLTPRHRGRCARRCTSTASTCSPLADRRSGALRGKPHRHGAAGPEISLNPVMTIGAQIVETLRAHRRRWPGLKRRALARMLEAVQIRDPERVIEPLSARGFRRHGPAGDDRHDADRRARPADRRRADLGAGRDGAGRGAVASWTSWSPGAAWG
jgi:energy-coupling factor transporter ATP-binding protein EcfA2